MAQDDRLTRTARYVLSDKGLDGVLAAPEVDVREGTILIPRLTYAITPKVEFDAQALCRTFEEEMADVVFFADTSLFDWQSPPCVWNFLLRRRRLVLLPPVLTELDPWLERNPSHPAAAPVLARSAEINFPSLADAEEQKAAFGYYVNLLAMRKRLVRARAIAFETKHGRPPSAEELSALKRELHHQFGERGYILARKGVEGDAHVPIYYTDEVVVYSAFEHALKTGQDAMVLTNDEDLAEQFYKLQWMLDTHYRSMLLARAYKDDPAAFPLRGVPDGLLEAFEGTDSVLIERSPEQIADVLPHEFQFVMVSCWVLGDRLTQLLFGAETGMNELLGVKGRTRGLNTEILDGRNLHLWLAPYDVPAELRGCAAVARDRRVRFEQTGALVPIFDVNQTLYTGERFKRLVDSGT